MEACQGMVVGRHNYLWNEVGRSETLTSDIVLQKGTGVISALQASCLSRSQETVLYLYREYRKANLTCFREECVST